MNVHRALLRPICHIVTCPSAKLFARFCASPPPGHQYIYQATAYSSNPGRLALPRIVKVVCPFRTYAGLSRYDDDDGDDVTFSGDRPSADLRVAADMESIGQEYHGKRVSRKSLQTVSGMVGETAEIEMMQVPFAHGETT